MRWIIDKANEVLNEFGGSDIFETAENSGANVWFRSLGGLKGFYICENGKRYIVVNEALDDTLKKVVCAHEFGHDMLHRELSVGGIRESTLFLDSDKTEREANLFASCVLVSDNEVLDAMAYSSDIKSLSSNLGLPPEIIKYKFTVMKCGGYEINIPGGLGEISDNFLK